MQKMLSIVYITKNRCEELNKSILSCEQHISIPHEYVVVDNASEDNTAEMVDTLIANGLEVNYLLMNENKGVAGAREIGFKVAKGDVCYFIDDDATVISEGYCLDKAYNWIKTKDNVFALGTDCYDTERKTRLIRKPEKGKEWGSLSRILTFVGCSHFIFKEKYNPLHLYPSNLIYGSEELYCGLGIYASGGCIMQFSDVKVLHEPSKNTRESVKQRRRHGHINTFVVKQYMFPFPYSVISSILFLFRIIRFEKCNFKIIISDIKIAKERYAKKYSNKLRTNQIMRLIKYFGIKQIL